MILVTKDGRQAGRIGESKKDNKEKIYNEYLESLTKQPSKQDDSHIEFYGTLDEKPGKILNIRIKRGTWDIMDAIVPMILKYCNGDIVEIGMGESTEIFANHAYQSGVNLFSCDIQMGGMFKVFDKPLFENHFCFTDGSDAFMKEYAGSPSVVFIDGEHKYETVKREAEFFLPKIKPGGVMFLHDTMPVFKRNIEPDSKGYNPGDTYKFRQELERNPDYDVFTWPYSAHNMGLTMVMVHGNDRPHWKQNGRVNAGQ